MKCTFFIAPATLPASTPLRIAVPAAETVEDVLLRAVRAHARGCHEQSVDFGLEGPDAELALLDYWTDLPRAERARVWGACGSLAGALRRFPGQPTLGFALLAPAESCGDGAPNAQARSLLMADYPETWALALGLPAAGPDADAWRARLADTAWRRWTVGLPTGGRTTLDAFRAALGLAETPRSAAMEGLFEGQPPSSGTFGASRFGESWLDAELHAGTAAARSAARAGDESAPPPRPGPADSPSQPGAEEKVLRGRGGRLFLARDSHDSHRQIVGERPLPPEALEAWERATVERMARTDAVGARLVHLIGPAPQIVHHDDLPDSPGVSGARPAQQLLDRLGAMRPAPEVVYPLRELVEARGIADPFSKTDSHWNDLGAFLAYEAVLDRLGDRVPARRLGRGDVSFVETCYVGDLGDKLRPQRASAFLRARIAAPSARLLEDNRVRNHGRHAIYTCDEAPRGTCVVFGDSWAYPLLLYLAPSFRRVVFFHRVNVIDDGPLTQERPDLVLLVLTERFCSARPHDADAIPFERIVAKKRRAGDLVPDTLPPLHPHPFLHSVRLERTLPRRAGITLPPA